MMYEYLIGYNVETIQGRGVYDITDQASRSFRMMADEAITPAIFADIEKNALSHATKGWAVGDREIHRVAVLAISRLRPI